ncbi:E3 ubiquitin-protein ligase [Canna indica]|uniref:E3 ubiquitin-protein ligase n=1 Tax=Canna indica TaxID=4628 RepID=A0AAQ3Q025_9LILI|nr:E3 ubiquitin-protein ligase [Canna indica]
MLPGVELARKRRIHHHHDGWARGSPTEPSSSSQRLPCCLRAPPSTDMDASALAARLRLEEKLRGIVDSHRSSLSSSSTSSSGSPRPRSRSGPAGSGVRSATSPISKQGDVSKRELQRTGSRVDVCAVCLDEVRAKQRVTWLPCSHKYHTECVLPWLSAHSHCPCCRTEVPSLGSPLQHSN